MDQHVGVVAVVGVVAQGSLLHLTVLAGHEVVRYQNQLTSRLVQARQHVAAMAAAPLLPQPLTPPVPQPHSPARLRTLCCGCLQWVCGVV